ncbi:MAG: hypothetical protein ACRDPK_05440, partial [Carbonactinosporaceae bacterium]
IHVAPPLDTARASGRVLAGFFTGLCGTPLVFGALVDATGAYLSGWALTALMFAAALAISAGPTRRRLQPPGPLEHPVQHDAQHRHDSEHEGEARP